jgi:hypothetical protein
MTDYFDNDWQAVADTPACRFTRVPFIDLLQRAASWDAEFTGAVMRIEDPETGKVTEKRYKRVSTVHRTVQNLEQQNKLVTVYTAERMYSTAGISSEYDDDDDEE